MCDQAALQEAIQRARELATKMASQAPPAPPAPAVKRPASELDHHRDIGTVKVTLAYEKPAHSDNNKEHQRSSSSHRDNNYNNNRDSSNSRDRDRERERDRDREKDRDRDRDSRDRDSSYSGGNSYNNNNNNNNNSSTNTNAYSGRGNSANPPSNSNYGSMLPGNNQYSSGTADERIEIIVPHAVIGLVIGKGGENIKRIQNETGATVRVDPNTVDEKGNKVCTITGTKQAVEEAHSQVSNVIENAAANKRPRMQVEGADCYRMKIPASRTGAIIGKGGDTIKSIKQQSGCDIELDKGSKDCGPEESVFIIRGTQDKIMKARSMIEARLASRGRDGDNSNRSNNPAPKGVATGANAAPVAQFSDLPSNYPAAGQQNSADMSAAWAAYFAQYSSLFNQAGAQPGAAGMHYGAQPTGSQQVSSSSDQSLQHQVQPTQQQDYTDQWIEYYLKNGRPDYAESIIQMKKQQQAQKQQQQ